MTLAWVERNNDAREDEVIAGVKACLAKGIQPVVTTANNTDIYGRKIFAQCTGGLKTRPYMEHIDDISGWDDLLQDLSIIAKRTNNRIVFVEAEETLKEYWSGEHILNRYALRTINNNLIESKLRVVVAGVQMFPMSIDASWPTNKGWKICVAFRKQAFAVGYYGWVDQKRRMAKYVHKLFSYGYDVYFCHAKRETHTNGKIFWAAREVVTKRGPVLMYPGIDHWKETMESL